jgi:hypothetical protein
MIKRSLGQIIFFGLFGTFGRYVTNLRGTFVENVKNAKNQPTLMHTVPSMDSASPYFLLLFGVLIHFFGKINRRKVSCLGSPYTGTKSQINL